MCSILQLFSAPLNPRPAVDHFQEEPPTMWAEQVMPGKGVNGDVSDKSMSTGLNWKYFIPYMLRKGKLGCAISNVKPSINNWKSYSFVRAAEWGIIGEKSDIL